jgi:Domain of unknown function (DUF4336)
MPGLEQFAEDVWTVDGPSVQFIGLAFPTRMIIVRLVDDSLWVNSRVVVRGEVLDEIKGLGDVKYLVAPTKLHVWRLEAGHKLFPDATLWAAPQIPREFKHLPFAGTLGDEPPINWAQDLEQLVFKGNLLIEEVFFFHKRARTLIVADFIQNHRRAAGKAFQNVLVKFGGVAYPNGGVPRDIRLTFTNRKLARRSLEKVLSWDFDRLIIAHGVCIAGDAKRFVREAFQWLDR